MDGVENLKENITPSPVSLVLPAKKETEKKFSSSTPKKRNIRLPYIPPHRRYTGDNSGVLCPKSTPKTECTTKSIPIFDNISIIKKTDNKNNIAADLHENEIIQRVIELANTYINLEFKGIANKLYEEKYNETLPKEVLNSVQFDVKQKSDTAKINTIDKNGLQNGIFHQQKPKNLNFTNINKEFWINVFSCQTLTEIYGAIIDEDHFEKVEKLADEMESFYDPSIEEGEFYALLDGSWHRVKCLKCHDSTATVLFIDRGDKDEVFKTSLLRLHENFCFLPAQAIKMSMSGLEIFSDCDAVHKILNDILIDQNIFVKVNSRLQDENKCLTVQLYLQKNQEIINVNDLVMNQMFKTVLNPYTYIELDQLVQVKVSHITDTSVYIKLDSTSSLYFEKLMKEFSQKYICDENFKRQMVIRFDGNKTYLVKNQEDGNWYRARILQFINDYEVRVILIDIGSSVIINREDFILIEKLSNVLAKYPEQSIEVHLDQVSEIHYPTLLNQLPQWVSNEESLHVMFIKLGSVNNNVPIVQLFRKANASFIFVNDKKLLNEQQLHVKTNNVENSAIKLSNQTKKDNSSSDNDTFLLKLSERLKIAEKKNVESLEINNRKLNLSSLLRPPNVPNESYFDVHVVMANNPSCFAVQLLRDRSLELPKMVFELSKNCDSYKGPKLTHESIRIGQLYATKCNDQQWYRAYVTNIIDTKIAKVYYCDYGNTRNVNIENLIPLKNEFYKLPYQAIWAELYGVKPVTNEWSISDGFWFKDLILSRSFVCRVENKREVKPEDKVFSMVAETIYELELIDTSTVEDVYIKDLLIDSGRALLKRKNKVN